MDTGDHTNQEATTTFPPGYRALRFEEFKAMYRAQKRADLKQYRETGHTEPWLAAMRQRRDLTFSTGALHSANTADPSLSARAPAHVPPSTTHWMPTAEAPAPPAPRPRAHATVLASIQHACAVASLWLLHFFQLHWLLVLQIAITSIAMFGSWSWKNLAFTCIVFAVLRAAKWVARGLRVEHPGRSVDDGPTPLGRFILTVGAGRTPVAQPMPVSTTRKVCYIVAKCAETFVLSLWPNYSVESLEMQLQRDGILRERPPAPLPADGAADGAVRSDPPAAPAPQEPREGGEEVTPIAPATSELEAIE